MQIAFPRSQDDIDEKGQLDGASVQTTKPVEQNNEYKASYKDTLSNYLKSFVGSGIIAIPYAFAKSGFILAVIVTVFVSYMVNFSLLILVRVQESFKTEELHLHDLVERVFSKNWVFPVIIQVYLFQLGACISYIIFFMEFLDNAIYGQEEIEFRHQLTYGALALLIIIPTIFTDSMSFYANLSIAANCFIGFSLTVIIGYALSNYMNHDVHTKAFNFQQVGLVVGVSLFSFASTEMVLSLRNSMNNPTKFKRLLQLVNFYASLLTILFGLICSLGYGSEVNEIVIFSMPESSVFVTIVQITYALALAMSFPLQLLPALLILETVESIKTFIGNSSTRKNSLRVFQVLVICFLASVVPSFANFLSLIGSLTCSYTQFMLPWIMYRRTVAKNDSSFTAALMIAGTVLSIYSAIESLTALIES